MKQWQQNVLFNKWSERRRYFRCFFRKANKFFVSLQKVFKRGREVLFCLPVDAFIEINEG